MGAVVLTLFFLHVRIPRWRALLAVLLGVPAYFVAFLAFAATVSYIQHHGGPVSSLPSDMKFDRLLGLLAAVTVASLELECLAFLLSKKWSTTATIGLLLGGVSSVALAYVGSLIPARTSGSTEGFIPILMFFGPLFIVGGAFATGIIGEQVLRAASPEGGFGYTGSGAGKQKAVD
jgi:hypothetical protein